MLFYKKGNGQPRRKKTGIHNNNLRNKPSKHALKIKVTILVLTVIISVTHLFSGITTTRVPIG